MFHSKFARICLGLIAALAVTNAAQSQTANWQNGEQQNYIGIGFSNARQFSPAKGGGYVHYNWTCPSSAKLRNLGEAIVNRTFLGTLFGTYNGTYIVRVRWVGNGTIQPNTLDQVLLSFEYNDSAEQKVSLQNRCASLFPQNLNYDTSVTLTISLAKTDRIGISDALAGPVSAMGKVSGLFLASTPGIFTDLTSAFQLVSTNKATVNSFLANFSQSIQSTSEFTFESDASSVSIIIGEHSFGLRKTWIPSVAYRGNDPSTVSEQFFLQKTGVSLANIKSSISSTFRADIETPALFTQRCSAYRDKLTALGLTEADAVLLLWAELANHTSLSGAACFTARDIQLLTTLKMPAPYRGAF